MNKREFFLSAHVHLAMMAKTVKLTLTNVRQQIATTGHAKMESTRTLVIVIKVTTVPTVK